jgi:hypothetical protein
MNSREIKFRAVFPKYDENGDRVKGKKVVSINSFTIKALASYEEHEWEFSDGSTLPANDDYDDEIEYIEYTQLDDKNVKEIYEGDVVDTIDFYQRKFIVQWLYDRWVLFDNKEWILGHRVDFGELEVIGNIYENENLLD